MKKVILDGMKHNNQFEDGERVILKNTGEEVTVNQWSYATNLGRYTYSIVEHPSTFYFENELEREKKNATKTTE